MDQPITIDQQAALLAEVTAARQPAQALRLALQRLHAAGDVAAAAAGAGLFESVWYTLPPFEDDAVPATVSPLYLRIGRPGGALLMAGLAVQLQRASAPPVACYRLLEAQFRRSGRGADADDIARRGGLPPPTVAAEPDAIAAKAAAIAATREPGAALLHALELLARAQDWAGSATLFESVWHRVPPMLEYWIYHRMAHTYAQLGRKLAAFLVAAIAVQMEPADPVSDAPYRHLLTWFRDNGRWRDAALLCRHRAALCPQPPLLPPGEQAALLDAAGPLPAPPTPAAGRRDIALAPRDVRPASDWPSYGGDMAGLRDLRHDLERPPIHVAELCDAEMLIDRGAVAVFGPDGRPRTDLSPRDYPALVRRRFEDARMSAQPFEELTLDAAVLIADEFPAPNLCHFMLDHASRLVLYRNAGIDIAAVAVIGPELRYPFQHMVAERGGIRAYVSVARRARLRIGRLWVSSNCRHVRHPAHWGAPWAVGAVRDLFDVAPRAPARRLLISRADSPYRRIANQAEVEDVLAPFGFETIVPGRMPFPEQVAAFRDATHVVGPHGAGLANILFCAPATRVLEVFHPLYGTWAYAMIAPTLGLHYAVMVGRDGESDDPVYNDPALPQERRNQRAGRDMRVDLDELRRWLADAGAC